MGKKKLWRGSKCIFVYHGRGEIDEGEGPCCRVGAAEQQVQAYHFTIRTRQTKMEREELNVLVWQESLS
jgi:hypothetical protein